MPDAMDWFEAYEQVLTPLFTASNLLQVVAGAEEAGLLAALREPITLADLAVVTGLPAPMAEALCAALLANEVVEPANDDRLVLTRSWQALSDPGAVVPIGPALAGNAVEGRLLRAGASSTYWSMPTSDRLTYARAVSPDPYSDGLVASMRAEIEVDPSRSPMLQGGRMLELGCGLAGRLLTTLRAVPTLRAVGVELSKDLAEAARARATDLGLSDRFAVVCTDAAEFTDAEPFDFGWWSQFFFPSSARAGALATMLRCLRPGGTFAAPIGTDVDAMCADPTGGLAREWHTFQLILRSWGIPARGPDELMAEVEAAGFSDVHVVPRPGSPVVVGTRP